MIDVKQVITKRNRLEWIKHICDMLKSDWYSYIMFEREKRRKSGG